MNAETLIKIEKTLEDLSAAVAEFLAIHRGPAPDVYAFGIVSREETTALTVSVGNPQSTQAQLRRLGANLLIHLKVLIPDGLPKETQFKLVTLQGEKEASYSTRVTFELSKDVVLEPRSLTFWWMNDDHTFVKINATNLEDIIAQVNFCFDKDPYGMLAGYYPGTSEPLPGQVHGQGFEKADKFKAELRTWLSTSIEISSKKPYFVNKFCLQ